MTKAVVEISGLSSERAELYRKKLPFAAIKQGKVVIQSQLDPSEPINDHLVWLWGMIHHERKLLKRLQDDEGSLTCRCEAKKGTAIIRPNGAEMLHLLNMDLVLETR